MMGKSSQDKPDPLPGPGVQSLLCLEVLDPNASIDFHQFLLGKQKTAVLSSVQNKKTDFTFIQNETLQRTLLFQTLMEKFIFQQ